MFTFGLEAKKSMACPQGFPVCCHSRQVHSCNSVLTTCLLPVFVSLTSAPHNEDCPTHKCARFLLLLTTYYTTSGSLSNPCRRSPSLALNSHNRMIMILIWSTMSWTGKSFNSFTLLLKLSAKLLLIRSHLMAVLNPDLYHSREW